MHLKAPGAVVGHSEPLRDTTSSFDFNFESLAIAERNCVDFIALSDCDSKRCRRVDSTAEENNCSRLEIHMSTPPLPLEQAELIPRTRDGRFKTMLHAGRVAKGILKPSRPNTTWQVPHRARRASFHPSRNLTPGGPLAPWRKSVAELYPTTPYKCPKTSQDALVRPIQTFALPKSRPFVFNRLLVNMTPLSDIMLR